MRDRYWAIFFVAVVGLALYQNMEYGALYSDYNNLAKTYNSLSANQTRDLNQIAYLNGSLGTINQAYQALLGNYSRTRIIFQPPSANQSVPIWTRNQTVPPRGLFDWNLLDTFDNHISISTNMTVTFLVMTDYDFAYWQASRPYTTLVNQTSTQFHIDEQIAQGCGLYVLVIWNHSNSTVLIHPNVTATYAATPFLTGICQ